SLVPRRILPIGSGSPASHTPLLHSRPIPRYPRKWEEPAFPQAHSRSPTALVAQSRQILSLPARWRSLVAPIAVEIRRLPPGLGPPARGSTHSVWHKQIAIQKHLFPALAAL